MRYLVKNSYLIVKTKVKSKCNRCILCREVLPFAPNAFRKLVDDAGRFRVPTVFVTNAGNRMRRSKAEQLSNWLGIEVTEDQVVMSHVSPNQA